MPHFNKRHYQAEREGKMGSMTTRDLGIALRDHFEGKRVCHFKGDRETGRSTDVEFIDVSDADNPVILLENGQKFQIRICIFAR